MYKDILFGDSARQKMLEGINVVGNCVKVTLGPKGRNIVIEKRFSAPLITNDGVSIARDIELKDKFMNMGARLLIEVAQRTNEIAGDGTTTAIVLAQDIINRGIKHFNDTTNPMLVKKGIEIITAEIVERLEALTQKVESNEDIKNIATISSNSIELGQLIADIFLEIPKNSVVTIEDANSFLDSYEIVHGMQIESGYISHYMVTNKDKMIAELIDPYILVTDKKIENIHEIVGILELLIKANRSLIIISDDISEDTLATLILNKQRNNLNVVCCKVPSFGDYRKELLKDIALFTGTELISVENNGDLKSKSLDDLGKSKKAIISKEKLIIIDGYGNKIDLMTQLNYLDNIIKTKISDYEKDLLMKRIANLNGKVAVLRVGGFTDVELKDKKLRIEDAINSCRAALDEGIIPGGGIALASIYRDVKNICNDDKDINLGIQIVTDALLTPLSQILRNGGYHVNDIVASILKMPKGFGFNALNGTFGNMFEMGVIDALKVTKNGLINATNIASMFLTTEAAIITIEDNPKNEFI